ncbi:MAG: hypothetical protein AAGF68_05165, partial [Pseudomonadota bacterium]
SRLASDGVIVPPPGRYRALLRDTMRALDGLPASPDMAGRLLDVIADEDNVDRLVLSDQRFVCINRLVVQSHRIWPMIERRARQLRGLFPHAAPEFFIGMRDPSTLIPALFRASRFNDFAEFSENMLPHDVRWSDTIQRLRKAQPDARITVWCNEDTPLIWSEIMAAMAGLNSGRGLEGREDLVQTIMQQAGFRRLMAYLAKHKPEDDMHRRRIVMAFLDKYTLPDALTEELKVPGWTEEMIEQMGLGYDEDMERVAEIDDIDFIVP